MKTEFALERQKSVVSGFAVLLRSVMVRTMAGCCKEAWLRHCQASGSGWFNERRACFSVRFQSLPSFHLVRGTPRATYDCGKLVREHQGLFEGAKLHQVGPLHLILEVPELPAQVDCIDFEDVSIGVLVGHRPDRYNEYEAIQEGCSGETYQSKSNTTNNLFGVMPAKHKGVEGCGEMT